MKKYTLFMMYGAAIMLTTTSVNAADDDGIMDVVPPYEDVVSGDLAPEATNDAMAVEPQVDDAMGGAPEVNNDIMNVEPHVDDVMSASPEVNNDAMNVEPNMAEQPPMAVEEEEIPLD